MKRASVAIQLFIAGSIAFWMPARLERSRRLAYLPGAPVQELQEADFEGVRLDADLQLPIHLKELFSEFQVIDQERIRDHDAVLLPASSPSQSLLELFFDKDSGLLLRKLRFSKSPLGLDPTRIDYDV